MSNKKSIVILSTIAASNVNPNVVQVTHLQEATKMSFFTKKELMDAKKQQD